MTQAVTIVATEGDLATLVRSFARHLRAANVSPQTEKAYLDASNLLAAFLAESGMPTDVASITREQPETFIAREVERASASSARVRYSGLRAFWKWLVEEGEVKADPFAKMRPPKVGEKADPVLSEEEISRLFRACAGNVFDDRRDLAILRVAATTGVRRAEIAGLRWSEDPDESDVDLDDGVAIIRGKGNRERYIPLNPRTVRALDRYLRV